MNKIDLKKELKHLYAPSPREVVVVDVPRFPSPSTETAKSKPDDTEPQRPGVSAGAHKPRR